MNENATFVEDGMDDDIEFDDYSEEEEDVVADIDAVSSFYLINGTKMSSSSHHSKSMYKTDIISSVIENQ